ncbi:MULTISPECIES: hypothetical protein [Streptomyces]|uniref:Lipoprotein n=2 Tax=Streptomyces rimosus TaxID=1927 RepID=A0ABY3YTE6_STRRM|nr:MULTISPECIES: hypothetical protein [Streptomyces]KOG81026.1 hypothetical protein ADK78_04405 [Kitasatospora aureofaciens]KOT43789.1 hypothetical protein ADK42_07090 [Streptomyces rimosus subsp. rimosus]KOT44686.1 hypothetical protein ADK84_06135 [Streptomyces sp. NRRL WC-3701]KOT64712.1 hypothetical protein ADK44_08885 [Streptomyces rimosus subsp. rimosus]KOT66778.1 hypothetical protein ADK45_10550 [Streptomyces rimosus subsp. rimosus]
MFLSSSALRPTVAVLLGTVLLTGCSGGNGGGSASGKHRESAGASGAAPVRSAASGSGGAAASLIAKGPGPQAHYTVQAQPAPGMCHYRTVHGQPLQDASCTPGALNPDVTQATLKTTVCRTGGYTSKIRPPVSVTSVEKAANARSYGYTAGLHDAEYDHLVSLELGGDPNDARNLWVEPPSPGHTPGSGPNNPKDAVENKLHQSLCSGQITLDQAQQAIATDWTTALATLHLT